MTDSGQTPYDPFFFTFLRHSESVGNAEGIYQGQSDFPLSQTGIRQVNALAERWQCEQAAFDLAISSPLSRARQTAMILCEALDLRLELEPLWTERDFGEIAGLRREEAHRKMPRPSLSHPYEPMGKTGGSRLQLFLGAGSAVQELLKLAPGRYLVISTQVS